MSLESKVISGARWSTIGTWSRRLVSFLVFAVVARHVEPESLGLIALAMVYIVFIEMFAKQGIGMAIIREKKLSDDHLNTAFIINMGAALALAVASYGLSGPVSMLFGDERLAPIIRILAITLPINASYVVPISLQSRNFDFKSVAMQSFFGTFASGLVSIPMAFLKFEVWALVAQTVTFSIVSSITIWLRTDWRPSFSFSREHAKEIANFSFKVLLSNIVVFFRRRFDHLIIGSLVGPASLGLYALGRKLNETIGSFAKAPVQQVSIPAFSRLQGDKDRLEKAVCRGTELNTLISCPIYIGLALLAPEAVAIAFTDKWLEATNVCSLIALVELSNAVFFANYHVLMSHNYAGRMTCMQFLQASGVILASLIGTQWGIEGVAIGILISGLSINIVTNHVMTTTLKLRALRIYRSMATPLAASILMALAVHYTRGALPSEAFSVFARAPILALAGALVYIAAIRLFSKRLSSDFMSLGKKFIGRKQQKPSQLVELANAD